MRLKAGIGTWSHFRKIILVSEWKVNKRKWEAGGSTRMAPGRLVRGQRQESRSLAVDIMRSDQ